MSDYIDQDDLDNTEETPLVKRLRKELEKANKRLKLIEDDKREGSLKEVLAKVPADKQEKVKRLIGETDPHEWFSEYGDVFAVPESTAKAEATEPVTESVSEETTSSNAALQTISTAMSGGSTPDQVTRLEQKLKDFSDPTEMVNYLTSVMRAGQGQV